MKLKNDFQKSIRIKMKKGLSNKFKIIKQLCKIKLNKQYIIKYQLKKDK